MINGQVQRSEIVVRWVEMLGTGRTEADRHKVRNAKQFVRDGQGNESETNRSFQTIHRPTKTTSRQYKQVQQLPTAPNRQTNGARKSAINESSETPLRDDRSWRGGPWMDPAAVSFTICRLLSSAVRKASEANRISDVMLAMYSEHPVGIGSSSDDVMKVNDWSSNGIHGSTSQSWSQICIVWNTWSYRRTDC